MPKLDKTLLFHLGQPLSDTQQIHVNHEGCPAGLDRKRRLYVKKVGDTILGYCHHCNSSGIAGTNSLKIKSIKDIKTKLYNQDAVTAALAVDFPPDTVFSPISSWPIEARAWLYKYGLTDKQITELGIGYSKILDRVILPVWDSGTLAAWQGRRLKKDGSLPKYTTNTCVSYEGFAGTINKGTSLNTVFVCEDLVSYYKMSYQGLSVVCLLGTSASPSALTFLSKFNRVVLCLDPDIAGEDASKKIAKELFLLLSSKSAIYIANDVFMKQPKEFNNDEFARLKTTYIR
jgi:Toprim-like